MRKIFAEFSVQGKSFNTLERYFVDRVKQDVHPKDNLKMFFTVRGITS